MDLICNRVFMDGRVAVVELTDSAGAYIVLRIDTQGPRAIAVPEVGTHYDLVARMPAHSA